MLAPTPHMPEPEPALRPSGPPEPQRPLRQGHTRYPGTGAGGTATGGATIAAHAALSRGDRVPLRTAPPVPASCCESRSAPADPRGPQRRAPTRSTPSPERRPPPAPRGPTRPGTPRPPCGPPPHDAGRPRNTDRMPPSPHAPRGPNGCGSPRHHAARRPHGPGRPETPTARPPPFTARASRAARVLLGRSLRLPADRQAPPHRARAWQGGGPQQPFRRTRPETHDGPVPRRLP